MQALEGRELATFGARAAAIAIDFVIAGALFLLVVYPIALLLRAAGLWTPSTDVVLKLNFFGNWYSVAWLVLYFGVTTCLGKGQTPGKRLLRIRVLSLVHERMGLWHSIERALGYGASVLEFGFGFVQYFLHHNRRTVHDRIAETIVVRARGPSPSEKFGPGSTTAPPSRPDPAAPETASTVAGMDSSSHSSPSARRPPEGDRTR